MPWPSAWGDLLTTAQGGRVKQNMVVPVMAGGWGRNWSLGLPKHLELAGNWRGRSFNRVGTPEDWCWWWGVPHGPLGDGCAALPRVRLAWASRQQLLWESEKNKDFRGGIDTGPIGVLV